jgi:hypothetical protein
MVCGVGEWSILAQFALVSIVLVLHLFTNMKKATCKFNCYFLLVDCILHIDLSPIQFPFHPEMLNPNSFLHIDLSLVLFPLHP